MTSVMKAVVQDEYGSADVLRHAEVAVPQVGDEEVLIRVAATGLNAADRHTVHGHPHLLRLAFGLRRPKKPVVGSDVAGRVEAVGSSVVDVAVGHEVVSEVQRGGLAELVAARADLVGRRPAGLSDAEAAALPMAGLTALQAVRDAGQVTVGSRVLVNGASSAVGTFAVQIAVAMGATVTGVCSTANVDLVTSLGVSRVVDYTAEDFTGELGAYDVVIDIISNRRLADCRRILAPGGRYVLVGAATMGWFGLGRQCHVLLTKPFVRTGSAIVVAKRNKADLEELARLVESGRVRPVVERTYAFADAVEAFRRLDTGRVAGKVVVLAAGVPADAPGQTGPHG